jgi:hypothetical protein
VSDQHLSALAAKIAEIASRREAGPGSDDNGSAYRALRDLAYDLGYQGTIRPANARAIAEERARRVQAVRGLRFLREVKCRIEDFAIAGAVITDATWAVRNAAMDVAWELYGALL